MANPRQRSKARSHKSHGPNPNAKRRLHHKLRKAPPMKGPEVLQQGWDKKKTVFQNYAALGLLPSIPIPQGASSSRSQRVKLSHLPQSEAAPSSSSSVHQTDDGGAVKVGFGRIIRDDEGNVVDIIIDDDEDEPAPAHAHVGEDDEDEDAEMDDEGDEEEEPVKKVEAKTDVVRKLEQLAATSAPITRHTSTAERTWLQALVEKYGSDTSAMSRDRKLNVWQKTEGEIKRAIKKAGGGGKR